MLLDLIFGFLHCLWLAAYGVFWIAGRLWAGLAQLLRGGSTTFGSARWATLTEIARARVWGGCDGIIVGQFAGRFLRFRREGYAILFARTRTGKGAGVVVPNLLGYPGSVICTDPKGENHAITRRAREARGPVFTLNVIEPAYSDCLNPLDMIRVDTIHEADDGMELAKLLVIPDTANGGHWDNRATNLLLCLILYVCHRYADVPELRNLAKVRGLVALGWDGLQPIFREAAALGPVSMREAASGFLGMGASDEARSVVSNADKSMAIWSADRPAGMVTAQSTFDFRDFNRQVMTAYICIDEEKLPIYGAFMRVMMGCALIAMTRAKSEAPPAVPTLLLMDEAAALGRIEPLETGVGYLGTYARLLLVFQDMDQLTAIYPKAGSMLANAGCRIFFGISEPKTAKMLADAIGHRTVASHSSGLSQHNTEILTHQVNQGVAEAARYHVDPSELTRLRTSRCIIFMSDDVRYPILAGKIRYWKVGRWRGLWDPWRPQRQQRRTFALRRGTGPSRLTAPWIEPVWRAIPASTALRTQPQPCQGAMALEAKDVALEQERQKPLNVAQQLP